MWKPRLIFICLVLVGILMPGAAPSATDSAGETAGTSQPQAHAQDANESDSDVDAATSASSGCSPDLTALPFGLSDTPHPMATKRCMNTTCDAEDERCCHIGVTGWCCDKDDEVCDYDNYGCKDKDG